MEDQQNINRTVRNERVELDVVHFSWNAAEAKIAARGSSNFLPEIQRQLEVHDWTDLPAELSVGDNPDQAWTMFLPPGVDLST